jgi:hypothetical protein
MYFHIRRICTVLANSAYDLWRTKEAAIPLLDLPDAVMAVLSHHTPIEVQSLQGLQMKPSVK